MVTVSYKAYSNRLTLSANYLSVEDAIFCGRACGSAPYELYNKFPNASDHDIKVYREAGHGIHLHNYAQELMNNTLAFLKRNGY